MEILRSHFLELKPQAADAVAHSPDGCLVAVARHGADLEIWDAQKMQVSFRIPGDSEKNIRSLVWKNDDKVRLFGAGLHGEVVEWDLEKQSVKSTISTYGGAAYDMCSTPSGLAVACDDGSVRLFDVEEEMVYKSALRGPKSKVLSLCLVEDSLFVGGSDGVISRWSLSNATCSDRMVHDKEAKNGNNVWCICYIGDSLLASGDSTGIVMIWDLNTCTLVRKFADLHQADVFALSYAPKLGIFASGGMDAKVSCFSVSDGDVRFTNALYSHSRDVSCMSAFGDTLVSAGADAELHFHPLSHQKQRDMYFERVNPYAGLSNVVSVSERLVLCQQPASADIWYLDSVKADAQAPKPIKMFNLKLDGTEHLLSSDIYGELVAMSNAKGTRIFKLSLEEVSCHKLPTLDKIAACPATVIKFLSEKMVVLCGPEAVFVYNIETEMVEEFAVPGVSNVAHLGQWLALADIHGGIKVINLDLMKMHCQVPGFDSERVTAMCIDESHKLMIASSSSWKSYDLAFLEKNDEATHDSSRIDFGMLPSCLSSQQRVVGIHRVASGKHPGWLFWGQDFLLKMNPANCTKGFNDSKKRVRDNMWKVLNPFQFAISFNLLSTKEFDGESDKDMCLVCEIPKDKMESMLPQQFERRKFQQTSRAHRPTKQLKAC